MAYSARAVRTRSQDLVCVEQYRMEMATFALVCILGVVVQDKGETGILGEFRRLESS